MLCRRYESHAHVLCHSKTVLVLLGGQASMSAWSGPLGSPAGDGLDIEHFLPHLMAAIACTPVLGHSKAARRSRVAGRS